MVRALRRVLTCVRSGEAVAGKKNPLGVSDSQNLTKTIPMRETNKRSTTAQLH